MIIQNVNGAHIVGGEIYYDCLGNDNYRVTLKIYRDCLSGAAEYDSPLILGVYRQGNGSLFNTFEVPFPGSQILPVVFNNPCVTPPSNICIQEAVYTTVINLPASPDGYVLSYQRCCRGPAIINLTNPDSEGLTLTTKIPGTNTGVICNSSPRFNNYPPLLLCNNEQLLFDHSATDPDGDEIVYELSTPYTGGSQLAPLPNPPSAPPYIPISWENGFNASLPFGNSGPINLNSATGMLTASPQLLGKFVVGVSAKEYRNGVLINETLRDFIFTVFNCNIALSSVIVPQESLSTFVSYCQGLTVHFENNSYGGTNYLWDFGVENDPLASSSAFEPVFTYDEPGIYEVSLIVNPGWACSDTITETFEVYNQINTYFAPPDPQCITGNMFSFSGSGDYEAGASLTWDFGPFSSPISANGETITNVEFDTSGYIPITFSANLDACSGSYTDSIFIYRIPEIGFDLDTGLFCAPQLIHFYDTSLSDSPLIYSWDFGDGTQSNEAQPIHLYQSPGLYDVSFTIESTEGCILSDNLTFPSLIEVFPSPISLFSVSPQVTDVFNTEVSFTDESTDGITHFYFFNDSVFTTDRNTTHHYYEGGYHYPYQLVINDFGCRDSVAMEIYVEPFTTFYIPNSFTPNNDEQNPLFIPIIYDVSEYEFSIYNRWGQIIFQTTNRLKGWDGTINYKDVPEGVYVWKIQFKNHLGIFEDHIGHVNLFR